MSPTAPAVQGACPSVHRPFHQLDGELLRIRLPGGLLRAAQARAVAEVAPTATFELTGRANLQLRGLAPSAVGPVIERLVEVGLVHPDPRIDERRNLLASPLAGLDPGELVDVRPLVAELEGILARNVSSELSPTFGLLLDGGGAVHLRGRPAGICLGALRGPEGAVAFEVRLGAALALVPIGSEPVPVVAPDHVARLVEAVVRQGGTGDLGQLGVGWWPGPGAPSAPAPAPLGLLVQRPPGMVALGVAPVLGRLEASRLAALADVATRRGHGELRVTPWRSVVLPGVDRRVGPSSLAELEDLGFVVSPDDPAAGVVACVGSQGCPSGLTDSLADARAVIEALRRGGGRAAVHVSGCEKRCAGRRPGEHDVTFVGGPQSGRYQVLDREGGELARDLEGGSLWPMTRAASAPPS